MGVVRGQWLMEKPHNSLNSTGYILKTILNWLKWLGKFYKRMYQGKINQSGDISLIDLVQITWLCRKIWWLSIICMQKINFIPLLSWDIAKILQTYYFVYFFFYMYTRYNIIKIWILCILVFKHNALIYKYIYKPHMHICANIYICRYSIYKHTYLMKLYHPNLYPTLPPSLDS